MPEFLDDRSIRYEQVCVRTAHRLTALYSVDSENDVATEFGLEYVDWGSPVTKYLKLDRLSERYEQDAHQFPRVLFRQTFDPALVDLQVAGSGPVLVSGCRLWGMAVPHGALVVAFTFELVCDVLQLIDIMESVHYKQFRIAGACPWEVVKHEASDKLRSQIGDCGFGAEVHQMLFPAEESRDLLIEADGSPNRNTISQLIYRFRSDYRKVEQRIQYPPESNRNVRAVAAVGPYGSVVFGNQSYVENAYFVSTVLMVGSSALLRHIRRDTYEELLRLRRIANEDDHDTSRLRTELAIITERLSRLEIELSFGVEANANVASLLPSLRVTDYHNAVFSAAELPHEGSIVSHLVERLDRAIRFELESVKSAERLMDERRRLAFGVFAGFLSIIAVPLAIVFGFFSVDTDNVSHNTSMFDFERYSGIYLVLLAIIVFAIILGAAVALAFRRSDHRTSLYRKQAEHPISPLVSKQISDQ